MWIAKYSDSDPYSPNSKEAQRYANKRTLIIYSTTETRRNCQIPKTQSAIPILLNSNDVKLS